MGNKKAIFAVGTTALTALGTFVACGSDKAKPDAPVQHDAPIDSPKAVDAPPDASPYDFTCYGGSAAGSAADPITISGNTATFSGSAAGVVADASVDFFKAGSATAFVTTHSGSDGSFASGNIVTGGTPFDGFIKAAKATYRISYLYPPSALVASLTGVPVPMLSDAQFSQFNLLLQQQDNVNGLLLVTVTDCNSMPLTGSSLVVKQGSMTYNGIELSSIPQLSQLHGIFIVANVPDGATEVSATFGSMTFPMHTVDAHKQEALAGSGSGSAAIEGTITITAVRPGP